MYTAGGGYDRSGKWEGKGRTGMRAIRRKGESVRHAQGTGLRSRQPFRFFVFIVLISISFLFGNMVSSFAANSGDSAPAATAGGESFRAGEEISYEEISYRVKDGDTLWHIARAHLPQDTDIRHFVHEIRVVNGLTDSLLMEGQVIVIPSTGEGAVKHFASR